MKNLLRDFGFCLLLALSAATVSAAAAPTEPPAHRPVKTVASSAPDDIWTDLGDQTTAAIPPNSQLNIPSNYRSLQLDFPAMRSLLANAPHEKDTPISDGLLITLPLPNGTHQRFRVVESPIISAEVQSQMPDFHTFLAQGVDDPTAVLRLDISAQGFHAYGRTSGGTLWIDPSHQGDVTRYLSAWKHDFNLPRDGFKCGVTGDSFQPNIVNQKTIPASGTQLRTYRMILTLTGEYTVFFGGGIPAQAAALTTINRVNSIYEVDVAVRFSVVNFSTYLDPATDPFPTGAVVDDALLDKNQMITDTTHGAATYDIGHILTQTSNGGVASFAAVCTAEKAKGGTGHATPSGDAFDVDFVAHEVGHQMGASHTFNGTTSSCGGNRSAPNAYELGSGTTIMAYAGICGAENVQTSSDPYFHVRSLEEIIATRDASGCGTDTPTGNTPPVANAGPDRTIPRGTAFYVRGSLTDPDTDAPTFCWEQFDLGMASPPTDPLGPLFRSINPTSADFRYFPDISQILDGSSDPWEILPTADRSLTLRLTVRDNAVGGGGVDDDEIELTVLGAPFKVTYPNGGETFNSGEAVTVTWDVGGSVAATVFMFLRHEGGWELLGSNIPNTGSTDVTMPCGVGAVAGRIWIEEETGVYEGVHILDVSDAVFSLIDGTPDYITTNIGGYSDALLANSTGVVGPPVNLVGDAGAYLWAGWANVGTSFGCSPFENLISLDEDAIVSVTVRPALIFDNWLLVGPYNVRGGRHTLWQFLDPDNLEFELSEANNSYARQWVWTPTSLGDDTVVQRIQPPERFRGQNYIPGGVTAYLNLDGLRVEPTALAWRASAISSLNGSDYDIHFFTPSTGPEDGFEVPLITSEFGDGTTDVILASTALTGATTYDVGYDRFSGAGDFLADHRVSDMSLTLGAGFTSRAVAINQMIDVGSLVVGVGQTGNVALVLENVTATQPVELLLFAPTTGLQNRGSAVASAIVDAEGRAVLVYDATTEGQYAWLLVRDASAGTAPFSFDLRTLANPPDLAMATLPGSHGPVVPRPIDSIIIGNPIPAPALLPGDVVTTALYFHVANEGPGNVNSWSLSILNDGVAGAPIAIPIVMPGGSTTIYSQVLAGTIPFSGGRHTAGYAYDVLDENVELFENNNRYAEQWVWEPAQLTMGQSLTRAAPPPPQGGWNDIPIGVTRITNQDGLRTPLYGPISLDDGFWGGYALAPIGNSDVDLVLHNVSTGAQDGFDDFLSRSEYGGNLTEYILIDMDGPIPLDTAFDAGAELYSVATPDSYRVHAMQSTYLSNNPIGTFFGPFTLPDGELMALYEFSLLPDTGPELSFNLVLDNLSGGADLVLVVQERTDPTGLYVPYFTMPGGPVDNGGPGQNEVISLTLGTDQYVAVAVIKKSGDDVDKTATFTLDFLMPSPSEVPDRLPTVASLAAYPNPFNPQTNLSFTLASAGRAKVQIYDAQGRLVRTLVSADLPAGKHNAVWRGRDDNGRNVASGVYLTRFVHPDGVELRRMVLMK